MQFRRPLPLRGRIAPVTRLIAAAAAVVLAALVTQLPDKPATAAPATGTRVATQALCGPPKQGTFTCFALRRTDVKKAAGTQARATTQATEPDGYAPADLHSAYGLPADGGAGATVAIVDAFDDPNAEADLAVYRQQYGLPACTTANGCFRKADQQGGGAYPAPDDGWAGEISLDLDMVSAAAPQAHILLVEADDNSTDNLGTSVNTAVALGARYVSNSYGSYGEDPSSLAYDEAYFDHPGTAIVASSADDGYGVSYPASSPYVTSVGGTTLTRDGSARGWSETVWNSVANTSDGPRWGAPGSGCSQVEPKPPFQTGRTDADCPGRSVADVSAVSDPATGVAVYNSYSDAGWNVYGGTSAASPIIAAVYADAGTPVAGSNPASYPYLSPGALNDVTSGDNASCPDSSLCGFGTTPDCTPRYECVAGPGYDGPTGLGTPDGLAAFRPGPHATVAGTVTDASTGRAVPGASVTLGAYHATTDSAGGYQLVVPAGTYPLSVTAFGYADQNVGDVDLADGASLSRNVALTPVPTQTISGTVRDGGGHGWGVYARVAIDGVPGTAFTDPATGAYTVKVPMDHTYTLHATALYPGYQAAIASVAVAESGATANLTLPLSTTGALAPGYAIAYHGGGLQSFEGSTTPDGWTVTNHTPAGGWQFDDPLNRGNQTGGTGHFAIVDDYALGWAQADTELVSPSYDFSAEKTPELDFDTALPSAYRLDDPTADVDVSTDNGQTWTTVWHHTDVINGPAHEVVPLDAFAGKPSVRVRFHFSGGLTGTWQLDNVAVGTRSLATLPGGLLTGQVTDANTGAGVLGATVSDTAAPDEVGHTVATPGDPARPNGLYWLFSGRTGKRQFTAGLPGFGYPAVTAKVSVAAGAVTTADFALHPGQLRVNESAIGDSVAWGASKTVSLTVKNTGGSPATVTLGEQAVGAAPSPAAGAARQRVKSRVTPLSVAFGASGTAAAAGAPTDQAWQPMTDLPTGTYGGIAAVIGGVLYAGLGEAPGGQWSNALYSYDQATASWTALASATTKRFGPAYGVIRGKLYVTGGRDAAGNPIKGGEVYDPATNAWDQIADAPVAYGNEGSAVLGDKLYVIGGCDWGGCGYNTVQVYDPATDTWSTGTPYPAPVSFPSCATVDGTLYCAGGAYEPADAVGTDTATGYKLDPASGAWTRIADAPVDFWGASATAADGRLLTAGGNVLSAGSLTNEAYAYDPAANAWSAMPNLPAPVMEAAGAIGWYVVGGLNGYSVPQAAAQKLPGYDAPHADVPWLAENATTLTIGAGKSATVKVTLDATAMGPADAGDHAANLLIDSDTPYGSAAVPLSMTVTAPAGWGELTGTVTGKGADGTAVPLAGATVQVDTKNGNATLSTDERGQYRLWLPAKDNPLTVIVAATGYQPDTRTVKLVKGGVVAADFALAPR